MEMTLVGGMGSSDLGWQHAILYVHLCALN